MTDPLIDPSMLLVIVRDGLSQAMGVETDLVIADGVLTYLREVLTPEALRPLPNSSNVAGEYMHRRIFEEDE
mgnify:CR=1 FL=1